MSVVHALLALAPAIAPQAVVPPEIVVTGEREKRRLRDTAASVSVFGGEDIEKQPAADRLESLDHDILTLQERAKLLQDEVGARLAEETNRSLRALSILTALLLPGSLVAGIFGMNTKDLPFLETEGGFWFAILIGAAATALFYWILRRVGAGLRI